MKYLNFFYVCNTQINCLEGSDEFYCNIKPIKIENCTIWNFFYMDCKFTINSLKNMKEKFNSIQEIRKLSIFGADDVQIEIPPSNYLYILNISFFNGFFNSIKNLSTNFPNLVFLTIINSNLKYINTNRLTSLQYLDVSHNLMTNFSFLKNTSCHQLLIMNVSFTKINRILKDDFENCTNLIILKINNCPINFIQKYSFFYFESLEIIEFEKVSFSLLSIEDAYYLKSLKIAIGNSFYFCCLLKNLKSGNVTCSPTESIVESCTKLIALDSSRIVGWLFGIFGILFNSIAFYLLYTTDIKSKNYRFLLTLSDFMTSIYFIILSLINEIFKTDFLLKRLAWRKSILCQSLGSILTISTLLSVNSTLLITLESLLAIIQPLKENFFSKYSKQLTIFIIFKQISILSIRFVLKKVCKIISFNLLYIFFFSHFFTFLSFPLKVQRFAFKRILLEI